MASTWREGLTDLFLVRSAHSPRLILAIWCTLAAASIAAATAVALRPGSLQDLHLLRDWLHYWIGGGDPYARYDALDYPPSSFFVLWPVALPRVELAGLWLITTMVASLAVGAAVLVKWFSERLYLSLTWYEQSVFVAMMLAGSPLRGAIWRGNTTPLAFLFGALAVHWCARRPALAALALAFAAFKPHIAIGFALIIFFSGRRIVLAGAAVLVAAKSVLFSISVDRSVLDVAAAYAQNLVGMYDGPDRLRGLLSIRWVLDEAIGNYDLATVAYAATAVASFGMIAAAARRSASGVTIAQVSAACLLWSLLFLPQQLYNGVLAAPALWLMVWPEGKLISGATTRLAVVSAFVTFGVVDIPRVVRFVAGYLGDETWIATSYYLSPLRLAVLFALLLYTLSRVQPSPGGPPVALPG